MLTRQQALEKAELNSHKGGDLLIMHTTTVYTLIHKIYNDHEAQLKALQQRSCEGCIHRSELHEGLTNGVTNGFCVENGFFTKRGFCCNRYKAKEQL